MNPDDFRKRTYDFSLKAIRLVESLPKSVTTSIVGKQLLRCGTSIAANYRSACRARSRADFVSKMTIVEEECDEALYWLELLAETGKSQSPLIMELRREGSEILSMVVSSIKTARARG